MGRESDQGGHRGPDQDKRIKGPKGLEPEWSSIDAVVTEPVELRRERIELDSRTRQDELHHHPCGVEGEQVVEQVVERKSRPLRREQPLHAGSGDDDDRGRARKREPRPVQREPEPLERKPRPLHEQPFRRGEP